jgi:hypothetical protein
MRIQIIIDDGDVSVSGGGGAPKTLASGEVTIQEGELNPQWRGPVFFLKPEEAAEVKVPGAAAYLSSLE